MTRKNVVYNTVGATLLLTGTIVWLSGVDLIEVAANQASELAGVVESAVLHPVILPVWAIALLCVPTIWLATAITGALAKSVGKLAGWRPTPGFRSSRRARAAAPEKTRPDEDSEPPVIAELPATANPARDGYCEDAVYGVVWRWLEAPDASELSAHCPACDEVLVPWANGGSLSRGLHCEQCNKLRAAGEHPSEVFDKVADALGERKRTGDWRAAPRRVDGARSAATRPLANLPAA